MSNPAVCPSHGQPWKYVKPGVSKAGKPYPGFYCCQDRDCPCRPEVGWTPLPLGPVTIYGDTQKVRAAATAAIKPAAPNWDRIAAGKCRSLAICAWLQSGKPVEEFWDHEDTIQAYMMEGRTPFNAATDMPDWDPADPGFGG